MTLPHTFLLYVSNDDGWFLAVIGALAGVYLFYHGFRLLQRKRLITDTPASKIRSASMGLVEVSGLAVGPYTLTAPITGLPCYHYRTVAWEWKQEGKNKQWVKVADESLHVPFFLDDNTGRVLIDPQGAEMEIHRDLHDEFSISLFSGSLEIPSTMASFLARNGVSCENRIKVEEYCIKPKNALFVLGTLAPNPGLAVSPTPIRSVSNDVHKLTFHIPGVTVTGNMTLTTFQGDTAPEEIIRLSDNKPVRTLDMTQQGKITAALIKAGITNPAAWAAAGVSNAAVATATPASIDGSTVASQTEFDLHPSTVLIKGDHNPAFFISWRSQRDVVESLGWKSALMIWGGPALCLLCVYILMAHFYLL